MSESNAQEPTMEEILASIRRIISEDDAPAAPAPEAEDDDVLELMDPEPPAPAPVAAVESIGDIEAFAPPPPRPEPAFSAYDADDDDDAGDALLSAPTANQAASSFTQLSRTLAMPAEGRTLEDVVREMLRPMLKDWLDSNLPGIVETAVQAEVERISRRRL